MVEYEISEIMLLCSESWHGCSFVDGESQLLFLCLLPGPLFLVLGSSGIAHLVQLLKDLLDLLVLRWFAL